MELKACPRNAVNWVSKLLFLWLTPLFWKGWKGDINLEDLFQPPFKDRSGILEDKLNTQWINEAKEEHPNFAKAILRTFGKEYVISGFCMFIREVPLRIAQALLLGQIIQYLNGEQVEFLFLNAGHVAGFGLVVMSILSSLFYNSGHFAAEHTGMRVRVACSAMIYKKALKLSQNSLGKVGIGSIVNLLSNDLSRLDTSSVYLHYLWIGPLQLLSIVWILWGFFGWPCLVTISFLVLLVPLQLMFGKLFAKLRQKVTQCTDKRSKLMNEIITGLRVIKMYTWEIPFTRLMQEIRKQEMKNIRLTAVYRSLNASVFSSSGKLMIFFTLFPFILMGNQLTPEIVFVTQFLYIQLNVSMTLRYPTAINWLAELLVAITRLQNFLLLEEKQRIEDVSSMRKKIQLEKASVQLNDFILHEISFSLQRPQLLGVIGPVGSGKSSLLQMILGEIPLKSGSLNASGKIAYVSQESWLFGASLKENIILGETWDEEKYEKTLDACALRRDLTLLPYGDNSLVGEKGISLSGGQKARVSLARAVYANTDIYLLDDPLSAVDAKVGREIFEKCILGLLGSKIVILVTHQIHFLSKADKILSIDKGQVKYFGGAAEYFKTNRNLIEMPENSLEPSKKHEASEDIQTPTKSEEKKGSGTIQFFYYWKFFTIGNSLLKLFLLACVFVFSQTVFSGCDYFLKYWINHEELAETGIWIYTVLVSILFFSVLARIVGFCLACLQTSVELHKTVFDRVLRTPMKFVESNSIGRILNRLTIDFGMVDQTLPTMLFQVIDMTGRLLGSIGVICLTNQLLIIPSILLLVGTYLLRMFYQHTSQDVKRLESITRSPIVAHFSTTLSGLTTIRSLNAEERFTNEFNARLDTHSAVWFVNISAPIWLGYALDLLTVLYTIAVVYTFLLIDNDSVSAGLSISLALCCIGALQFAIRISVDADSYMVSFERLLEYTSLESEASLDSTEDMKPPENWPENGEINFVRLTLAYENQPVLDNLTLKIKAKEKIGVIGRTGAGKTSLISSLFRLKEPSSGAIFIDGVNILGIGLRDLRSRISIIPQDPYLFHGTLRRNLDPFGEFCDDQLFRAVKDVHLQDVVKSLGLDTEVAEGGANLSVGERQLICLARALLRSNKILVLDEATANIDPKTDALIQETIREKFVNCTVLTVAHRIATVLDSDKVLVLDAGKIVEFDDPNKLLENPGSALSSLVVQSGINHEIITRL